MNDKRPLFTEEYIEKIIEEEQEFICFQVEQNYEESEYSDAEDTIKSFVKKSLQNIVAKIKQKFNQAHNEIVTELMEASHRNINISKGALNKEVADTKEVYYQKLKFLNDSIVKDILPALLEKIPNAKKDLL